VTETLPYPVVLRPLGAGERMYALYSRVHPMHFSVAVELDVQVSPADLARALARLRARHVLLASEVVDGGGAGPVFVRGDAPVPVRVVGGPATWQAVVAEELARPLPQRGPGAAVRAVLLTGGPGAVVVLTLAHHVADGRSAVTLVEDLVRALGGGPLGAPVLSRPREDLLAEVSDVAAVIAQGAPAGPPSVHDERMRPLPAFRAEDGARPTVEGIEVGEDLTARVVGRARAEGTTVHGAVLAAAVQTWAALTGCGFVRVMSPVSLVGLLGPQPSTGVNVLAARTGSAPAGAFWDLAREHVRQLAPARSATAVGRTTAAITAGIGPTTTPAGAEAFMVRGALGYELMVSDLGVVRLEQTGPVRVRRLHGPLVLTRVAGEQQIGVLTHDGRMGLVTASHTPAPGLLAGIVAALARATG
jgi:hypothetical protein